MASEATKFNVIEYSIDPNDSSFDGRTPPKGTVIKTYQGAGAHQKANKYRDKMNGKQDDKSSGLIKGYYVKSDIEIAERPQEMVL